MIAVGSDDTTVTGGAPTGKVRGGLSQGSRWPDLTLSTVHCPLSTVQVFVYEYSDSSRRWLKVETFSTITDPVHDIAFAPNIGRSYHVLAVATKDLRIITLRPLPDQTAAGGGTRY